MSANSTIGRLNDWVSKLGIDSYSFVNCSHVPGPIPKMDDVDFALLQACASTVDKVVALGGFPDKALKKAGIDHFKMPHPSFRNRKLNDKTYEEKALKSCREYLNG